MSGLDEQRLSWKIEKSIFFFYGVFGFEICKLRVPDELSGTDLTNSKTTCGNKMLQYVSIKDKYKLNVIKYTVIVSAGNV